MQSPRWSASTTTSRPRVAARTGSWSASVRAPRRASRRTRRAPDMGKEFDVDLELDVDATPEQVWDAITTGPGIDSWFMGRNEVEPGVGGTVRTAFGDYRARHAITEWQPNERLAYGSSDPDGRRIGYEFLIEGRDGGSTVVRMVTSGFLPGDDW